MGLFTCIRFNAFFRYSGSTEYWRVPEFQITYMVILNKFEFLVCIYISLEMPNT
jgi:hypothetical protein